jgi:hypothetical protein
MFFLKVNDTFRDVDDDVFYLCFNLFLQKKKIVPPSITGSADDFPLSGLTGECLISQQLQNSFVLPQFFFVVPRFSPAALKQDCLAQADAHIACKHALLPGCAS